jgi:threonyl-tRNA synthetase
MDGRDEKIGYKIRQSRLEKIPYLLVVGEREAAVGQAALRKRGGEQLGSLNIEKCVDIIRQDIKGKE